MTEYIYQLLRENIRKLKPYTSAREAYEGQDGILLDANENSYGSPLGNNYHRYPDPNQTLLKSKISAIKGIPTHHIFLGNGSDEAIDLLIRAFCEPGRDNILILPPTYGMYKALADINGVETRIVPLLPDFQPNLEGIADQTDDNSKLLFICSPNNPTGNSVHYEIVEILLNHFPGLVVIDEAFINYARQHSFIRELTTYPNLVVLQTLSKAWGLAGLRLGMAFAGEPIIQVLHNIKYPYNINAATLSLCLQALDQLELVNQNIRSTVSERQKLSDSLGKLPFVIRVFPSDANFLLVQTIQADQIYKHLITQGIVVRNKSKEPLCEGCLRITIGTPEQNDALIQSLQNYSQS